MYNKAQRDGEYIQRLKGFLGDRFALNITDIKQAKRGFYGETWKINTVGNAFYFVKIDYCKVHQQKYISSLAVVKRINDSGILYITKLLPTKTDELYDVFDDGTVSVAEFIEGENREDYLLKHLFDHLSPIYKTDITGIENSIEVEDFSGYHRDNFYSRVEFIRSLPSSKPLQKLFSWLEEKKDIIEYRHTRLDIFANRCRGNMGDMYLTHGDAGGNAIINGDDFYVIDWDYAMISPIERDVWYFICDPQNIDMVNETLKEHGVDYIISWDRLAYYCYMTFFYYMSEYLQCVIDFSDDGDTLNGVVDDVIAYFDGWIVNQLTYADKNIE